MSEATDMTDFHRELTIIFPEEIGFLNILLERDPELLHPDFAMKVIEAGNKNEYTLADLVFCFYNILTHPFFSEYQTMSDIQSIKERTSHIEKYIKMICKYYSKHNETQIKNRILTLLRTTFQPASTPNSLMVDKVIVMSNTKSIPYISESKIKITADTEEIYMDNFARALDSNRDIKPEIFTFQSNPTSITLSNTLVKDFIKTGILYNLYLDNAAESNKIKTNVLHYTKINKKELESKESSSSSDSDE